MVYLPKAKDLIVFDRVNALDPSYRKAWLLHSVGRPEVSGTIVETTVPGHVETFDGDTVQITWSGGVIDPPDPKDPGRLFVKTFLPARHTIRRIGGKGHEFRVGGKNRPIKRYTNCVERGTPHPVEAGNWRIEVSPVKAAKFDNFLHRIHICDTKTRAAPPAEMIAAAGRKMVGVRTGGWLVMFGRKGPVTGEVVYRDPGKATRHLVVDLQRNVRYRVAGITGGPQTLTASLEGVLQFRIDEPSEVKITRAR